VRNSGRIAFINVSDGGVPKLPVERVEVTPGGLVGDRQANLKHHGGPERAVCLFSLEVLEALAAEGHPIRPGQAGENLTLAGLDWPALAPGARLRLGAGVVLEVTKYCDPCSKLRAYFKEGAVDRILQRAHPGQSRLYTRVVAGAPSGWATRWWSRTDDGPGGA
jgi:MOSC domain-containing protein YiiM